jgi:hypothetical protein
VEFGAALANDDAAGVDRLARVRLTPRRFDSGRGRSSAAACLCVPW